MNFKQFTQNLHIDSNSLKQINEFNTNKTTNFYLTKFKLACRYLKPILCIHYLSSSLELGSDRTLNFDAIFFLKKKKKIDAIWM